MQALSEIFNQYSSYTGSGIVMVLFFVALVYVALVDQNRTNRTVLVYGTTALVIGSFNPITFVLYKKLIERGTYWRFFWLFPVAIGLGYVGTIIIRKHRVAGLVMSIFILLLGGKFVYNADVSFVKAENAYQIPDSTIHICDYLESRSEDAVKAAFPPEMLIYVRQYDVDMLMPYGREQLDPNWAVRSGFFDLMCSITVDFEELAGKCEYNSTRYIIVNSIKTKTNDCEASGFTLLDEIDGYEIYEYALE